MPSRNEIVARLAAGGFVAPEEEADELIAAGGNTEALLARRLTGEPLAWITGTTTFCDTRVAVHPGVYVPRWQTETLARRAVELEPRTAIDLCTGCGAIAAVLQSAGARVVASDLDPRAVANARANDVDAHEGDLFDPLPPFTADLIIAVVPYVPTPELGLLQRDTLTFESALAYDGGPDGTTLLERVLVEAPEHLNPGGTILLELGGDQAAALAPGATVLRDEDGDVRGIEVRPPRDLRPPGRPPR